MATFLQYFIISISKQRVVRWEAFLIRIMEATRKEEAQRGRFKIPLVLDVTGYVCGGISDNVQVIELRATADATM